MHHKVLLFTLLILSFILPGLAVADNQIIGHMAPLQTEFLNRPITLDCGLMIQEWRGTKPTLVEIKKLNKLCTFAVSKFPEFIAKHNIKKQHNGAFAWNISLIPDGYCYRCLNDIHFRFKRRGLRQDLWGYTDNNEKYIWTISNTTDSYFKTIYIHEIFHALSMFYGIYDSHHPFNNWERSRADERLAQGFTEYLGLGR